MSDKKKLNPLAVALGSTFAVSLASSPLVNATDNPFGATNLSNGYMIAEGSCGGKKEEGKCGEGKCGDKRKAHEGKCGEGKCGTK